MLFLHFLIYKIYTPNKAHLSDQTQIKIRSKLKSKVLIIKGIIIEQININKNSMCIIVAFRNAKKYAIFVK